MAEPHLLAAHEAAADRAEPLEDQSTPTANNTTPMTKEEH